MVNPDFSGRSVSKLITLYDYDLRGYVKTEMAYDTTGRVRTETAYDYKLGVKTHCYFDSAGNRRVYRQEFFDSSMNVYRACYFTSNCSDWKNEFDKHGRIKKYSVIEKNYNFALIYQYRPNGLFWAIKTQGGGLLNNTARFTYEYWK